MIDPATHGMQLSKLMKYLQRMLRQSEHDIGGPLWVRSGRSALYHPMAGIERKADIRLAQLLAMLSAYSNLAERVGFEPTKGYKPLLVFKTSAFDHSATSPV